MACFVFGALYTTNDFCALPSNDAEQTVRAELAGGASLAVRLVSRDGKTVYGSDDVLGTTPLPAFSRTESHPFCDVLGVGAASAAGALFQRLSLADESYAAQKIAQPKRPNAERPRFPNAVAG